MSYRPIRVLTGLFVAVALILGAVVGLGSIKSMPSALAQPATPTPTAVRGQMHPLPPELEFLRGMTPTERFDHVLGVQITFQNPQGQQVVLNAIPGKIASTTANTVTITPNGTTQTRTFNVTSSTYVVGRPQSGSLSAFKAGDPVFVWVIGNSPNAAAITGPYHMWLGMR